MGPYYNYIPPDYYEWTIAILLQNDYLVKNSKVVVLHLDIRYLAAIVVGFILASVAIFLTHRREMFL